MAGEVIMHADPVITPAIEKRLSNVYKRHGAQATRNLAKRILGRWLSREELRFLCWIEKDENGFARAVDAHRLAWDQAGWKGHAWWKESVDSESGHDIIKLGK
jgi:hypothetical protein